MAAFSVELFARSRGAGSMTSNVVMTDASSEECHEKQTFWGYLRRSCRFPLAVLLRRSLRWQQRKASAVGETPASDK